MTATNLTASISNTIYPVLNTTYTLNDQVDQASTVRLTIFDASATYNFQPFQPVTISDTLEGIKFTGFTAKPIATKYDANAALAWTIDCIDNHFLPGKKTTNRIINNQYAGVAAASMVNDNLSQDGVVANYAVRDDNSQSEFAQGTLSGTVATSNLGGDLELAAAGSTVTITENTTSIFGSGSLTNCSASSNSLAPSATATIKLQGTESLTGDNNAFTYIQIFSGGGIGIISGRYLEYDIWIDPSSPEIKSGVDITFTDGTTLRDTSQIYLYYDAQDIPPHPKSDLTGYADGKWYHRKFLLDNFSGKTISYISIALEGDKGGLYTTYIKNIYETNGSSNVNTFFSGSFNVNPPKQLQNSGYSSVSCTIVNTYDCGSPSNRVSPPYSIDVAKILRNSFITWQATTQTGTNVQIEYSLDGGNSYTVCAINAALPNIPAGLSVASTNIQFRQTFQQIKGASAESKPTLTSMQFVLNPSYTASKTDITYEAATNAQWNAGGTTFTNTQAQATILNLFGGVRNWSGADTSGMTIFGGGASGTSSTTVNQHCNYGSFWIGLGVGLEGRSRLDFLGTWQDLDFEVDIYLDVSIGKNGIVYRTTGWSNYDANYAYAVEAVASTSITLQRGSNSSAASAGTRTQVATATLPASAGGWHRLKVLVVGSNHKVYLDDVLYINATDATYGASGNLGLRSSNSSGSVGYQGQFNNLGLTVTGLSGTWLPPSTSLTSAGTYGGSVVSWQDVSINNQSTTVLVESTINGGSSFQTVTNGGSIPNLTLGQSLSGISVQFRITLTTAAASSMPQVQFFVARILGGFSSSGTRIAPFLSLTNAAIAGATSVNWTATTPANTSVAVATSTDGSSYTNVANGGGIAGITSQPSATLDTFDSNSSPNYTSTFASVGSVAPWFWDTLNSRLTVTGGSFALLVYNSISASNVDIIIDMDQSDTGGTFWRYIDVNNYYQIIVNDASSSNDTNVITLVKRSGGTRNFLAAGAITFVRGTKRRIRATMTGGLITVYFDGTAVLTYIDPSPLGAGQVGLSHDNGTSHFYNFRVQPQGDNLSGKVVYVKATLSTTDPISTPQLTDLTVAALHPNIGLGALIPTADYTNTYIIDNLNDLAKKSDYTQFIDQNLNFIFGPRTAQPAPWILQSADQQLLKDGPLSVDYSADLYRNEMVLDGVVATGIKSESKIGDGKTTSWALGSVLIAPPTVYLNNQLKTIGIKGIDTGKDYYWTPNTTAIDQDPSGTLLQQTDTLLLQNFTYQYITSIKVDNTNLAGTITQKQFAARMGRTIVTQTVLNHASVAHATSGDAGDLDVSKSRRIAVDINITAVSGTTPAIQFFVDRKGVDGIYYPMWNSSSINTTGQVSTTIGAFATINQAMGATVRLRWTITGTTPSFTFSASVIGILDVQSAGLGIVAVKEDVSSQSLNVAAATAYGNGLLQRYGTQGRLITFKTWRRYPSLAIGQYLPVFLPEFNINDASMLITQIQTDQDIAYENGSPTQFYRQQVTCTESANLGSPWRLLSSTLK